MPMRAQFRRRNLAIGRKGAFEAELLYGEEEDDEMTPLQLKEEKPKVVSQPDSIVGSPVSVASVLDMPGEIKPIALPSSWVMVGKGGKPLKNETMYDEPLQTTTAKNKKKKKRTRHRKDEAEPESLVLTLDEAPSSSTCVQALARSSAQREKQVHRGKAAKHWASYQRAKTLQRSALDELLATLLFHAEADNDDEAPPAAAVPAARGKPPIKEHHANSSKDKARRRARSAAARSRCAMWDDHELLEAVPVAAECTLPAKTQATAAHGRRPTDERTPTDDTWTTVGKGGKAVRNVHLLTPLDEAETQTGTQTGHTTAGENSSGLKRHQSKEPVQAPASKASKKASKCTVM